jgi:hypothetical protein
MSRRRLFSPFLVLSLCLAIGLVDPRPAHAIPLTVFYWKDVYGLCPVGCAVSKYLCPCHRVIDIPLIIL